MEIVRVKQFITSLIGLDRKMKSKKLIPQLIYLAEAHMLTY